jgi:hypothetical protein
VRFTRSSGGRGIRTHGDVAATMVFKSIRSSRSAGAVTCVVGTRGWLAEQDHPAYIPRTSWLLPAVAWRAGGPGMTRLCAWCENPIPARTRRDAVCCSVRCRQARHRFLRAVGQAQAVAPGRPVTARIVQGMARVRSGQAPAWPLVSGRSARRGSGVKHDFVCTFTRHLAPVLVALRSPSCLRLEGRTRTLRGPSPDLSPAKSLAPSPFTSWSRWSSSCQGSGSSRENGVWGVPRRIREGRRAVRVRGDNTGGAAPWDRGPGREPRQQRPRRTTERSPAGVPASSFDPVAL